MDSFKFVVVLFSVIFCTYAKTPCNIEDSNCYTEAARNLHKLVIQGLPGKVESSDPLLCDEIVGEDPEVKFSLKNAKMRGFTDCTVALVKVNRADSEFDYNLVCPEIVYEGDYEVSGNLAGLTLEGHGKAKATCKDHYINIHGNLDINKENGVTHIHIKDFKADFEVKGGIDFDLENLFQGDQEKTATLYKFLADNRHIVREKIQPAVVDAFMKKYISHINDYLKLVPTEVMFAI